VQVIEAADVSDRAISVVALAIEGIMMRA
jgi:hypothetical protein